MSFDLVLFGGTGDLAWRKLMPALFQAFRHGSLPKDGRIVGVARDNLSDDQYRELIQSRFNAVEGAKRPSPEEFEKFASMLHYLRMDLSKPDDYARLSDLLKQRDAETVVMYVATAPGLFTQVVEQIAAAGLNGARTRIVLEKPLGHDLASNRAINAAVGKVLEEKQVFRIDHYLGKPSVQNLFAMRFGNALFEPIWRREHIANIQITIAEDLGVEKRGAFYDQTGALRDMVPNHLFQLLSLVAMEPPIRFDAHSVRAEKADVLAAIQPQSEVEALRNSVRGQYLGGRIGDKDIADYRAIEDVAPDSTTETYVALKLIIDNWRWAGVPFYLRTGKALGVKRTEVAIKFKQAPFAMFNCTPVEELAQNYLVIGVAPNEGIALQFNTKVPGPTIQIDGVEMKFRYKDYFKAEPSTGYETLIYDCMIGDNILFQRADSVEAGWKAVQPFIDAWQKAGAEGLKKYKAGSEGPEEANELLTRDGRSWRKLG